MLTELHQAHEQLLAALSDLEALTSVPQPDSTALSGVRWKLSRASSQRRRLVEQACAALIECASPAETEGVRALRQGIGELQSASSRHVGTWTLARVIEDWDGYRAASEEMRGRMRERIATEKRVLYPLLQRHKVPHP
jgi:hypothetical protein